MDNIRIGLTIIFIVGISASLIYSLILIIQFLGKRITKNEAMSRTFGATFLGIMSLFFAYATWQVGWNIGNWISFLLLSGSFSLIFAFFSTASFWFRKK